MMSKTPYVSDTLAWGEVIKKASDLKKQHNNQLGRGFARRFGRHRFAMRKKNGHENETKVEQVAPTVAIADRAVSELIQQKHDKEPHVRENKIKAVGIKRKKSKPNRISVGKLKGATAKKRKSKRTAKPKKKLGKKNKTRKIDFETVPSIFDRHTSKKWRI